MYAAQQELTFNDHFPRTLRVKANGGQLLVQKAVGTDWITSDTYTSDTVKVMNFGTSTTRFVPSGGCVFEVDE